MNPDLATFVRDQLGSKQTVGQVVAALEAQGHSQDEINDAFQRALHPSSAAVISVPPAKLSIFSFQNFDLTKALSYLGAALVIVALIVVIFSQWSSVGPFGRTAFIAVPMILLYIVGAMLWHHEKYHDVTHLTTAVASVLFPFALGTALFQFSVLKDLNDLLLFVSAAAALVLYVVFEFLADQRYFSVLTLSAFGVSLTSFLTYFEVGTVPTIWWLTVASVIVLLFGLNLSGRGKSYGGSYVVVGAIATLMLLPLAIITQLSTSFSVDFHILLLIISAFALLDLAAASFLATLGGNWSPQPLLYRLKRLLEEVSTIQLIFPVLILGFDDGRYAVAALVVGLLMVLIRSRIAVSGLGYVGIMGVIISLFAISSFYFANSIGWPIVIFAAGFIAIGLGLLVRKMAILSRLNNAADNPFGLGQIDEKEKSGYGISWWRMIAAIIFIAFALVTATSFLMDATVNNDVKSTNPPVEPFKDRPPTVPATGTSVTPNEAV